MTKTEMLVIVEKYGMELNQHPITGEFTTYTCWSDKLIPELDQNADSKEIVVPAVSRTLINDKYFYKVFIPSDWV